LDHAAEQVVDLVSRLAEEHHPLHPPADQGGKGLKIPFFVPPPKEEVDRLGETLQRPHHGADVCSLGIVVEADAVFLPGVLDPVGDPRKTLHGPDDLRGLATACPACYDRRHHVFAIVTPGKVNHLDGIFFFLPRRAEMDEFLFGEVHPAVDDAKRAEELRLGGQPRAQESRCLFLRIQDCEVPGGLTGEEPLLGLPVGGKAPMVVDMVCGHVQQNGDPGVERLGPLELEAAHLHDRPVRILRPVNITDQRGADVPSDEDLLSRCTEDLADQGCHGRLAVRSGDGDDRGRQEPRGEFKLAQHRDTAPDGLDEDGVRRINARRGNDPIDARQDLRPVGGEGQLRAQVFERGPGLPPDR
jgi:hypothetical protein